MNSLDHVTAGRIACNLVTSTRPADAANFGHEGLMDHAGHYDRMEEFVAVCVVCRDPLGTGRREDGRQGHPTCQCLRYRFFAARRKLSLLEFRASLMAEISVWPRTRGR